MIRMHFSLACCLLVVAVLCAVHAFPMLEDPKEDRPVGLLFSNSTGSPEEEHPTTESRASDKKDSNDELHTNAATIEPDLGKSDSWHQYKQKYDKIYRSDEEDKSRRAIFESNLRVIRANNDQFDKGLVTFKMGVNPLTDMSPKEYSQKMNGHKQSSLTGAKVSSVGKVYTPTSTPTSLPSTVDWRNQGYVTPVKDQGPCASCWAFSVTGVLEGQVYRSSGSLVSLSEQNFVDCSSSYGNQGCIGGMAGYTYDYIKANGGADTQASYPYTAVQSTCRYNASTVGARVTGYVSLPYGNEQALAQAVASVGPIAVAIDANPQTFQNYLSGIYYERSCKTTVNHAVLVVGYGTSNGVDYWIVKNSWGTAWGNKGYVYMSRNRSNQCGIASYATYPTL